MALFQIQKGKASTLETKRPNTTEGYCYFTTDDGKFYIDIATATGTSNRVVLNAYKADILRTARNLQVDLESTSYVSFDGSVDRKNIGISGVLGVANGGTGKSTHTANAVLTGNGTSAVKNVATASGALYATAANGAPKFGTLPVAQGGTGLTANPSMLINLASNSAASVLAASPRPGVTGTLAVGNGGTGKTSWTANALVYAATTTSLGQIDLGTSGYVLQSNGSANAPSWINATSSNTASAVVKRDADSYIYANRYYANQGVYYGRNGTLPLLIPDADDFRFSSVDSNNTSGDSVYRQGAIKLLCANNQSLSPVVIGRYYPNSHGFFIGDIYATKTIDSTTGLPAYSTFFAVNLAGSGIIFGTNSYNYYEKIVLDSNNYTFYTVTKTGSGASGEWNITAKDAKAFTSAASVTLTGDVTGTASSTKGWSVATTLANSGVTAGSYGPSANASPAHGGTFSVPYITFDAKGRATAASTKTITLPTYTIGNATITIKAGTGLTTGGSFTTNATGASTITLNHSNSITAGSVGTAQSPSHGGTFAIPKITYDAQGHITAATTVNITLPADNNTLDTAGSTNTSSKIFLVGATSQASFATTYSHDTVYVGTDGHLYSNSQKVLNATNYTDYTVTKTGTGASGTWNINALKSCLASNRVQGDASGYHLIKINSTTAWMTAFTVRIYQSYKWSDVVISGYQYGSSYWYSPSAVLMGSSTANAITVTFGYTSANNLWVAIPASSYFGVEVIDCVNGFAAFDDWKDLFTITNVTTLPSTTQTTVTAYRPWYRNETVLNATNASAVPWSGVTSKPSYYDAKAIKSITRSGTTFTATHLDGTTSTFTQQDNNNTYTLAGLGGIGSISFAGTALTVSGTGASITQAQARTALGLGSNAYTSTAYLPLTGGTLTGNLSGTNATFSGTVTGNKVVGAVWNDYAEYRWVLKHPDTDEPIEPGRCVAENGNDSMSLTNARLQAGVRIISDTYGMCMGETEKAKTPIAVCGRVLAYPFERKVAFNVGDPVCSGPNGTVSKMSREEAMMYPERIVGTVVSKPTYKEWGPNKIPVKGRIWIQVR